MIRITEMGNGRLLVEWTAYGEDVTYAPRRVVAECMECGHEYRGDLPIGFIYDDPAAGWRQNANDIIARGDVVSGYCKSCADVLAALDHADHVNGNWERRTIEDEAYVWTR